MARRFGLKLFTDHLPRIIRPQPPARIDNTQMTESPSPSDYWAMDCATNPWRKGCRTYDV